MRLRGRRHRWLALHSVAVLLLLLPARSSAQQNPDPSRFEKDIAQFEAQDRASPPRTGAVLFVGSSSIRYWDTAKAFPGVTTINRGFGGSHVSDNIFYADRIIVPYTPKLVVFYAGDADVAGGKSADQIFADFKAFIAMMHLKLPDTSLVIIGIKPSPAHWKHIDAIRRANALVASYVAGDRRVAYVDVANALIGADGRPRPEYYADNALNLSDLGYVAWTNAVRPVIERSLR